MGNKQILLKYGTSKDNNCNLLYMGFVDENLGATKYNFRFELGEETFTYQKVRILRRLGLKPIRSFLEYRVRNVSKWEQIFPIFQAFRVLAVDNSSLLDEMYELNTFPRSNEILSPQNEKKAMRLLSNEIIKILDTFPGDFESDSVELERAPRNSNTVSYTHLTLPTILLVQISVVAVSLKKKEESFMS
eukprot:TRINITY_DN22435_c0_g1_i4.p3 TRINITY_DN22435_c0_g1~~TRINITY_DN22435_c0_g1_i4.p3  ORF type:complete len:189 (-),score=33.00 TRINITY_DN22435_c0_g1_i4:69-635(-)